MSDMALNRYHRNFKAISLDEQEKLKASTVAVIGCGGLGGYIIEEFTRLGIGNLIVADGDKFDVTNLNRQLLSTESNIGEFKAKAAEKRIREINSEVKVKTITERLDANNSPSLLAKADLVCDALDSIESRLTIERVCNDLRIPLVFASIAGWYGMVGVSFPGDFSLAKIFSQSRVGIEKVWGNPAFTPAVVASLSVAESVKVLTGRSVPLRNSWLQIDLLEMEFERFSL